MDQAAADELISRTYNDPETGFGSVDATFRRLRGSGVTRRQVQDWFDRQAAVQVFREVRGRPKRSPVRSTFPRDVWEADLIDYARVRGSNSGFSFVLVAIDDFSKKVFSRPLKTKNLPELLPSFRSIVEEAGGAPRTLISDREAAIMSSEFQAYLRSEGVTHVPWEHAPTAERAIRTLKSKVARAQTARGGTRRWTDLVAPLTRNINSSVNRSTGVPPDAVQGDFMESVVLERLQNAADAREAGASSDRARFSSLAVGDTVRVLRNRGATFRKGFRPRWSSEVFPIQRQEGNLFRVNGQLWRREELLPVSPDSVPLPAPSLAAQREPDPRADRELARLGRPEVVRRESRARRPSRRAVEAGLAPPLPARAQRELSRLGGPEVLFGPRRRTRIRRGDLFA